MTVVERARFTAGILASKGLTKAIRLSGRGGGTALPGLVATKFDPRMLDKLAAQLAQGAIVVAGTNGKTTTTRMLASALEHGGLHVAHNRSGSNLQRGIAAALAQQTPLRGPGADIGVIEADENAFPDIVARSQPRVVVLLNLFRDQLDRYGELESIVTLWRPAIASLRPQATLVINADDPLLASLAEHASCRVIRFGIDAPGRALPHLPHAADAAYCRACGHRLAYETVYVSHLGNYRCPECGLRRDALDVAAVEIEQHGLESQTITVQRGDHERLQLEVGVPGLYNVYNALAVVSVAVAISNVSDQALQRSMASFRPAFGRLERVTYAGRQLTLALSKNPVGFNELIRTVAASGEVDRIGIGINDLDADGRDVSWLWDVDFERLAEPWLQGPVVVGGIRGDDMAVRLKYAGLEIDRINSVAAGQPYAAFLQQVVQSSSPGDHIFLLLTYTSLLQLRRELARAGAVEEFWEQ